MNGNPGCAIITNCKRYLVQIAIHLAVAGDVFNGVSLCYPFSHEMSWMRSGT